MKSQAFFFMVFYGTLAACQKISTSKHVFDKNYWGQSNERRISEKRSALPEFSIVRTHSGQNAYVSKGNYIVPLENTGVNILNLLDKNFVRNDTYKYLNLSEDDLARKWKEYVASNPMMAKIEPGIYRLPRDTNGEKDLRRKFYAKGGNRWKEEDDNGEGKPWLFPYKQQFSNSGDGQEHLLKKEGVNTFAGNNII